MNKSALLTGNPINNTAKTIIRSVKIHREERSLYKKAESAAGIRNTYTYSTDFLNSCFRGKPSDKLKKSKYK